MTWKPSKPGTDVKIGLEPPAHAPRESTAADQGTPPEVLAAQLAVAAAHERDLPAFAPDPGAQVRLPPGVTPGDPDAVAQFQAWVAAKMPADWSADAFRQRGEGLLPAVPRETAPVEDLQQFSAISAENHPNLAEISPNSPDPPVEVPGATAMSAVEQALAALQAAKSAPSGSTRPAVSPEAPAGAANAASGKHQPAASDTESPSRGVPKAQLPPDKQITGGFGVAAAAAAAGEYIPMDGSEVCQLLQAFLVDIAEKLSRDLRLSMAVTYPRVRARVELIVESYMADSDFRIVRHMPEVGQTPVDVARQHADEVCFVVVNQRQEVASDGVAGTAANAIRAELGLEIPYKQVVDAAGGRQIVDRRT